jgi:hypothetical protein
MATCDDFPDFNRRISIAVEYCTMCKSVMSSDGCSNPDCWKTRPLYPLQEAMRAKALNNHYGTSDYKSQPQRFFNFS